MSLSTKDKPQAVAEAAKKIRMKWRNHHFPLHDWLLQEISDAGADTYLFVRAARSSLFDRYYKNSLHFAILAWLTNSLYKAPWGSTEWTKMTSVIHFFSSYSVYLPLAAFLLFLPRLLKKAVGAAKGRLASDGAQSILIQTLLLLPPLPERTDDSSESESDDCGAKEYELHYAYFVLRARRALREAAYLVSVSICEKAGEESERYADEKWSRLGRVMFWVAEEPSSVARRRILIRSYELLLQRQQGPVEVEPLNISAPMSYSADIEREEGRYRKSAPLGALRNIFSLANIATVIGTIATTTVVKYFTDASFSVKVNSYFGDLLTRFLS